MLFKGVMFFLLGVAFSQFITPLPSLANTEFPLDNDHPFEKPSPSNWVTEEQIHVYQNQIIIDVENARWAKLTDTNSMDPVMDEGSNALQTIPVISELRVGDIISYRQGDTLIIHRIVDLGEDEQGWFAIVKGDNNDLVDPLKVREDQVEKVVIGIIY